MREVWGVTVIVLGVLLAIGAAATAVWAWTFFTQKENAVKRYINNTDEVKKAYDQRTYTRKMGWYYTGAVLMLALYSVSFLTPLQILGNAAFVMLWVTFGIDPENVNNPLYDESRKSLKLLLGVCAALIVFVMLLLAILMLISGDFAW